MNLLTTGGCGFIGTSFVRRAARERGNSVVNVDLRMGYVGHKYFTFRDANSGFCQKGT